MKPLKLDASKPNRCPSPMLLEGDPKQKRTEIREYFLESQSLYESLFDCLDDDGYFERPNSLRHPLIFYYGHTAVFYINKLNLAGVISSTLNERLESQLAVGVDEMSWDDVEVPVSDWPSLNEVRDFRRQTKRIVLEVIDSLELAFPLGWDSPWWVVLMGIEHERIHLETSSVLMRQLPLEFLRPNPAWEICPDSSEAPVNALIDIPKQAVELGRGESEHYYGWDNEFGRAHVIVPAFRASKYLVSNGEYLDFVESGGYTDQDNWSKEGARWRRFSEDTMPSFWRLRDEGYFLRCLTDEIEMPWDWPAVVNYYEAEAFCRWYSKRSGQDIRLPSEAEWQAIRMSVVSEELEWYGMPANLALRSYASECPVDRYRMGDFYDVVGNLWQWSRTTMAPFEGFRTHPIYEDFTTPTFDEKHQLIKGGSWISTGNEVGYYARFAFRPHFHQHAGFRYVTNPEGV